MWLPSLLVLSASAHNFLRTFSPIGRIIATIVSTINRLCVWGLCGLINMNAADVADVHAVTLMDAPFSASFSLSWQCSLWACRLSILPSHWPVSSHSKGHGTSALARRRWNIDKVRLGEADGNMACQSEARQAKIDCTYLFRIQLVLIAAKSSHSRKK